MATNAPTPRFIRQAQVVAALIAEGVPHRQIAKHLGVSGPRISQIKRDIPNLQDYLGVPTPSERLKTHRAQLATLRHEALHLTLAIRRDLRLLDEELEADDIDQLLGLRS